MSPLVPITLVGADAEVRRRWAKRLEGIGQLVGSHATLASDPKCPLVLVIDDGVALQERVEAVRRLVGAAPVIVTIGTTTDPEALLAAGADVRLEAAEAEETPRLEAALRLVRARQTMAQVERFGATLMHIGESGRVSLDTPEALQELLSRICDSLGWARLALLLTIGEAETTALLVAASDEVASMKIPLDLERYPEVRACFQSQRAVLVEEVADSPLLGPWAALAAERGGGALLAVPLIVERRVQGALLFRHQAARPVLAPYALEFLKLAAQLLGLLLGAGRVFDTLQEQTRRLSLARHEEERRARALEQFKDFFEASSDGMLVTDHEGGILYVNRIAEKLTGYARRGLADHNLAQLVAPEQRHGLQPIIGKVLAGATLELFDLSLSTTSGEMLTVSVSSSSVLAEHGAAVFAFRDVTEARALEAELLKTKDFLERLIDSTIDGIVCADLRGRVIIFNQGAARLYGYRPDEVIERIPVWKLYPDGVAKAIMAELRSPSFGGVGRLEPTRREIVTKDGDLVPVSLAASIVHEEGREMATVGIFSDLRERIQIEQRLEQAQKKLVVTEKQALIAELAGTAAHELNQPLTSVMGYSELLRKKIGPEDPHYRALDIIFREAERMAEIVRKIGRITRYETKTYVGSTQILDLDKSTTDD